MEHVQVMCNTCTVHLSADCEDMSYHIDSLAFGRNTLHVTLRVDAQTQCMGLFIMMYFGNMDITGGVSALAALRLQVASAKTAPTSDIVKTWCPRRPSSIQ
jgi:hypothetical protein